CRDADRRQVRRLAGRQAAAHLAAVPETAGRGFVSCGHLLARDKTELVGFDMGVGSECRSAQLAAIGAMAMRERAHLVDLEPHRATEAASTNHGISPARVCGASLSEQRRARHKGVECRPELRPISVLLLQNLML